jgi:hypothetical protein
MTKIFEAIDAINWEELEHAYGSAADVPEDLKRLFGADKEAAKEVVSTFWSNIYHQGTIYQATSYAVPFLIQALDFCPKGIKGSLVTLLGHIANGMSYNIQHQSLWEEGGTFDDGRTKTEAYKTETERQLHWVERGILAVWSGWDIFLDLLDDEDIDVKCSVGLLLVSLANSAYKPPFAPKNLPELLFQRFQDSLAKEKDDAVKVEFIHSIGALNIDNEKKIELFKYYLGEPSEVLKIGAAYYILEYETNEKAITILNKALSQSEVTDELFQGSVWIQMKFSFYMLYQLCRLPITYFDQVWDAFDTTIRGTFKFGAAYTVSPIVQMVFDGKSINEMQSDFTTAQKKVLTTILETDNLWIESDGNASGEFRKWGLERNREQLGMLLE